MDNVVLWIKSNRDVVDAYKRTKVDCNYHDKSDNDFLMFLLEAATNVLSIVHQFSPHISHLHKCPEENNNHENTENSETPETIVTKDDEINLEKLDKQLRINIVCPDLESANSTKQQQPPAEPDMIDSSSALQDISDHVNELESVLESLSKSCPSPLGNKTIFRPLSARTFLESLKPNKNNESYLDSGGFTGGGGFTAKSASHDPSPGFVKAVSESSFTKFKSAPLPISLAQRPPPSLRGGGGNGQTPAVRSSPNVTISAESQLNLAKEKEYGTIIKPIPMNLVRSPERRREEAKCASPATTPPPPAQENVQMKMEQEQPIDVVNTDKDEGGASSPIGNSSNSPSHQDTEHQPGTGVKRKAECLEPCSTEEQPSPPSHEDSPPPRDPSPRHPSPLPPSPPCLITPTPLLPSDLANLPSESELTQQLMSVIHSTLTTSSTSLFCSECGLYFPSDSLLHRHLLLHHNPSNLTDVGDTKDASYACPSCAFRTPRRQTLSKHITTVHSKDRSTAGGILYCTQCEYRTPTKSHLRNHMLAHSGNRQYQCPHCTYSSNFSNALTRHMTMHSRELFERGK